MKYVVAREVFYVTSFNRYAYYHGPLGCDVNAGYLIGEKFYLYEMEEGSYKCVDKSSRFYNEASVNLIDVGFLKNPEYCRDVILCQYCEKSTTDAYEHGDCKVELTCTLKGLVEIQDVRDYTREKDLETAVQLFLEENKKVPREYLELEDYINIQRKRNKQRAYKRIKRKSNTDEQK